MRQNVARNGKRPLSIHISPSETVFIRLQTGGLITATYHMTPMLATAVKRASIIKYNTLNRAHTCLLQDILQTIRIFFHASPPSLPAGGSTR